MRLLNMRFFRTTKKAEWTNLDYVLFTPTPPQDMAQIICRLANARVPVGKLFALCLVVVRIFLITSLKK